MSRRRLLALLCLGLLVATPSCGGGGFGLPDGGGNGGGGGGGNPAGLTMTAAELADGLEVARLVDLERTSRGLSALIWDDPVAQVAFEHSLDMDVRGYFDHYSPEGQGPGGRLSAAGIAVGRWAENIAQGQPSPASVVNAWMNSTGHRDNILNGALTQAGVGVRHGSGGPWWTHLFVTR